MSAIDHIGPEVFAEIMERIRAATGREHVVLTASVVGDIMAAAVLRHVETPHDPQQQRAMAQWITDRMVATLNRRLEATMKQGGTRH